MKTTCAPDNVYCIANNAADYLEITPMTFGGVVALGGIIVAATLASVLK